VLYGSLILLVLMSPELHWVRYSIRGVALVAVLANLLGVVDISRFGATVPGVGGLCVLTLTAACQG